MQFRAGKNQPVRMIPIPRIHLLLCLLMLEKMKTLIQATLIHLTRPQNQKTIVVVKDQESHPKGSLHVTAKKTIVNFKIRLIYFNEIMT